MPRHALGSRSRRLAWLVGLAVVLVARVGGAQVGVVPTKLIMLETGAGAKTIFVAKDAAIQRGTGTHPSELFIFMMILYDNGTDAPSWRNFVVPNGLPSGWVAYNENIARYSNRKTFTRTKSVVIKPGKLAKLVGQGFGDLGPLVVLGQGGAPTGVAKTAFCVQDFSVPFNQCFCSELAGCTWKSIAGGTGAKLVCRGGTGDPSCGALVVPGSTTTSTVITTTTSTTDPPRPVCCSYTPAPPDPPVTSCHWDTAAACTTNGGTPGPAGSICQPNGTCASPPLAAGECCLIANIGCVSFVPPNASAFCQYAGGTAVPNAVCLPDGSCALPTDYRCCDSWAGDPAGDVCFPTVVTVGECLVPAGGGLPGAPGTVCGGGGDCLPTPTAGTCCDRPDPFFPYPCYQTATSCGAGYTTVPNAWCAGVCAAF